MFRNVFRGCVSDRSSQTEAFRSQKLKFGASLSSALKHGYLPDPLVDILVHIAREGIMTTDVFRRPGNPNDTRRIVKRLTEGKQVIYANYSFYTLASVVKKFLLKIPGGIFTPEGEERLLQVLTLAQKIEQIEAVHSFIETLAPAHQQLVALLFGTWFRIVAYQEHNCMSVEALSRSVAGSMFHTCAEDPAKVERASRIMQFLIDNFGVEGMFGQENIRFFAETTHTGIHIQELYHYGYVSEAQLIPSGRSDFIEVTRMERGEEDEDEDEDRGLGRDREFSESPQPSPATLRHSRDEDQDTSQLMINTSTLSAPEVSLVPSPEVSKRPKSLEDNLNEVRSHYQNRCLSRFNSVKRKQLERLRQRSDWFLSPTVRERNNSRKGKRDWGLGMFSGNSVQSSSRGNGNIDGKTGNGKNNNHNGSNKVLQKKNSGNSVVMKASSEGAVLEAFSDGDSVFTDNTSRSESPASEPVWSHMLKVHSRDIIHSDTIAELAPPEMSLYGGSSGADLSIDSHDNISGHHFADMSPSLVRSKVVEEEEEGAKGDNEDEDNDTPTGIQEEEDTLMASSLHDLHQHGSLDKGSACSQELDKDSPLDSFGESLEDVKLKRKEGGGSFKSQMPISQTADISEQEEADLTQGQQPTQTLEAGLEQDVPTADETEQDESKAEEREKTPDEEVQHFLVEHTYCEHTTDS